MTSCRRPSAVTVTLMISKAADASYELEAFDFKVSDVANHLTREYLRLLYFMGPSCDELGRRAVSSGEFFHRQAAAGGSRRP